MTDSPTSWKRHAHCTARSSMRDALGARIADYVVEQEVSARSTENAYRATHRVLPRCARVAIIRPDFAGSRDAEAQLVREACNLEALHHAGAPRVFECGAVDGRAWVATEYIDGASIEQLAAEGPLAISDAIAILRDAAAILSHAHRRGIVHGTITPTSILRTATRDFPVCLTAWGSASKPPDANDALPVDDAYAKFYRAPELAPDRPADSRADVFALAAVMFEAATLVLPDPVQKFPGVPDAFHQLLASMLARDPDVRPSAAVVHAQATRLAEVFDGGATVEEVEVELVDISRNPPPMPNLGWVPPDTTATLVGTMSLSTSGLTARIAGAPRIAPPSRLTGMKVEALGSQRLGERGRER